MGTLKVKCEVVMLPTRSGDSFPILQNINGRENKLYIPTKGYYYTEAYLKETQFQPQHLYITSDEEIKEGDWITDGNRIYKAPNIDGFIGFSKIIATTDTSLNLPQLSKSFINKYMIAYNKGNTITDVMVEYEEYPVNLFGMSDGEPDVDIRLKISKDNTIAISKVKNSWSREEVEELCRKAHSDGYDDCMTYAPDAYIEHLQERWVKENL